MTARYKIIGDGNPANTLIIDQQTGKPLEGVVNVDYSIGVDRFGTAKVEFLNVAIDIEIDDLPVCNTTKDLLREFLKASQEWFFAFYSRCKEPARCHKATGKLLDIIRLFTTKEEIIEEVNKI